MAGDGRTLAAGDAAGAVSLVDLETGKVKTSFAADKRLVNATAWSDDGKFLAAGGGEGVVRVWSAADEKVSAEINSARGEIVSLAFADSQLTIGTLDFKERKGAIEIWDWRNRTLAHAFDEGTPALRAISVSPDGKLLASANFQRAVLSFILPTEGNGAEVSLRALPDSDDPTPVAVWDLTSGKRVALIGAETGARRVAFSPDGKMLACAGANGVMLYDIAAQTFAEIGRIDSRTSVDAIAFSPDSQQLFIAREREPLARFGAGAVDKLLDTFFIALTMLVREGASPSFAFNPKEKPAKSLTGGSNIEAWRISRRTSPPDLQTWEAVRAWFGNKPDEARKILGRVIKDSPNYGEAQRLCAVFFAAKDANKLRGLLEASVKNDPNCIACWRTLGDIDHNAGQELEAAKSYERVLQLKPEYGLIAERLADVYNQLALTLLASGNSAKNLKGAEEALLRALSLRPAEERYYTNLASVYYFRADFDKAVNLLLLSQKLRPDHARIYYNLGHAYRQKGDKPHALEAYRCYVQMGEEGEEERVERAKEYIKELEGR